MIPTGQEIPLGLINRSQPLGQLLVAPPLYAHELAILLGDDHFESVIGDHTSITDEHEAVEPESLVQVADGLRHGGVV